MFTRVILLALVLSLSACLGNFFDDDNTTPLSVGEEITLTGMVIGSVDDCIADGICAAVIETADGGVYNAVWATGMVRCEGEIAQEINLGDTVEVFGEVIDTGSVSACSSAAYYLRVVG